MAEWAPMTQSNRLLRQILVKTEELCTQGEKVLAVFDLDSTLFDVGPRMQQIFYEFSQEPRFRQRFPEATQVLETLQSHRNDWGIEDALKRAGILEHADLEDSLRDYWYQKFFSNEYLHFDRPYPGARQFVEAMLTAGSEIAYLTGRDQHRMGKGSLEVLEKWAFPTAISKTKLVLKPEASMDDAQFKSDWFLSIGKQAYKKIWFFENEPVNVNQIQKAHPEVEIVFFESTHSRQSIPPEDIPKILHFLMDED